MTQVIIAGTLAVQPKPVIGWQNLLDDGTVTASSDTEGYEKENAYDGIGTDYWIPSSSGDNWLAVDLGTLTSADYVGIARHTLGTENATFRLQYWDGSDWQDCHDPVSPGDDDVLLVLFDSVTATQFRLFYNSSGTPRIGAVSFGDRLTLEQGIFAGHMPEKLNRVNRVYGGRTEGGAFLPSTIIRNGTDSSISVSHLSAAFVSGEIEPFMRYAETRKPFFWAWRPTLYPEQVVWARVTDDPRCSPAQPGGPQSRGFWTFDASLRGVFR